MPYNLPEEIGGDSEENDRWMEECVKKVQKSGKSKDDAIAICKATLIRLGGNKASASFIISELFEE